MGRFSRFSQPAGEPKGLAQAYRAFPHPFPVAQVDAYLDCFTAIGNFGVPISQTSVNGRQAIQHVNFLRRLNDVFM